MKNNIEWIIHLCANGNCDECGKREEGFLPYTCNAHTHGMEKYGHMDFQLVLKTHPDEFEETGRTVLRIIIPDDENRFPEDEKCMEVYRLQLLETDELWRKGGTVS